MPASPHAPDGLPMVRAAAIAAVAALAGLCVTGTLQQDFAALWVAGRAVARGLDPYLNFVGEPEGLWDGIGVFRHSRFLYPPLVADLVRPLAAMPYLAAKAIFTASAVAAFAGIMLAAVRMTGVGRGRGEAVAFAAAALWIPLGLHLERGQVDLFVLLLFLVAVGPRRREWVGGAALALAVMLKPASAVALPFLALARRGRLVAWAGASGVALALLTVAVAGPGRTREYVADVLPRVALYGEGGTEAMLLPGHRLLPVAADLEAGEAVVDGRRYRQSAFDFPVAASLPRLLAPGGPERWALVLPILVLGVGLAVAARRAKPAPASTAVVVSAGLLLAVVASPTGWAMGGVAALPLAAAAAAPGSPRAARAILIGALALCALPGVLPANFVLGLGAALGAAVVALVAPRTP